jgi:ketosteroid isomerase-like protein
MSYSFGGRETDTSGLRPSINPAQVEFDRHPEPSQGRYSGSWAASGTSFDLQMAHIWDFEDGKVVRWQQCTDTLGWARATGDAK